MEGGCLSRHAVRANGRLLYLSSAVCLQRYVTDARTPRAPVCPKRCWKLETRTPQGEIMYEFVGRERFCEIFKGRAVMVPELPAGRSRVLAHTANKTAGRDDASLRTKSEYLALFDLLMAHVPPAASTELRLLDEVGRPTAVARVIEDYIAASRGKPEFFDADMYMFHITDSSQGTACLQSR